eukprot:COSAG02_NODE_47_length_45434_cov_101.776221_13_plen_75_part_00
MLMSISSIDVASSIETRTHNGTVPSHSTTGSILKFESREFRGFVATGGGIPPPTLSVVWRSVAPSGVSGKVCWV